jgi:hypothetical protein
MSFAALSVTTAMLPQGAAQTPPAATPQTQQQTPQPQQQKQTQKQQNTQGTANRAKGAAAGAAIGALLGTLVRARSLELGIPGASRGGPTGAVTRKF